MTSKNQVKANRINSQKSTGPRTRQGKSIVSQNAIKHGILSRELVLDGLGEKKEELGFMKSRLIEELRPVGILEEMLIDKILTAYWRLRRVIWAEAGEIKKKSNHLAFREKIRAIKEADRVNNSLTFGLIDRLTNSVVVKRTIEDLKNLQKTVEDLGHLPETELRNYLKIKGSLFDENEVIWLTYFNHVALGKVKEEDKEKGKKALLFLIEKDLESANLSLVAMEQLEGDNLKAKQLASSIPSREAIEKITRYEKALENQLYEAIDKLIKLQTLRKGGRYISAKALEIEGIEK